ISVGLMNRAGNRLNREKSSCRRSGVLEILNRANCVVSTARSQFFHTLARVLPAIDFRSALQRFRNASADILCADMAFEFGLLHQLRWLLSRAAKQQGAPSSMERVGQVANGAEAGSVNGGHVAQPEDHDGRQFLEGEENLREFVGGAEKKWPVNPVDDRVIGNVFSLENVDAAVFYVVFRYGAYGSGSRNFANKHQR